MIYRIRRNLDALYVSRPRTFAVTCWTAGVLDAALVFGVLYLIFG